MFTQTDIFNFRSVNNYFTKTTKDETQTKVFALQIKNTVVLLSFVFQKIIFVLMRLHKPEL